MSWLVYQRYVPKSSATQIVPIAAAVNAAYTTARLTTKSTLKNWWRITAIQIVTIGTIVAETSKLLNQIWMWPG